MVLVQKWPFFQPFFLSNMGRQNFFYDILKRKNAFVGYKNKTFKKSKNWNFSKGLTLGFGPKMAIFPTFLFGQYRQGKCLLRYSRTKKRPFLAIKKRTSKSPKIDTFPTGLTHGFGPKMAIFPTFLFRQYRPGKCLLRYSTTKKRLSKLQKQKVRKVDKLTFFQRG